MMKRKPTPSETSQAATSALKAETTAVQENVRSVKALSNATADIQQKVEAYRKSLSGADRQEQLNPRESFTRNVLSTLPPGDGANIKVRNYEAKLLRELAAETRALNTEKEKELSLYEKLAKAAVQQLLEANEKLVDSYRLLRTTLIENQEEQAALNDFWQRAAEGVDAYESNIKTLIPSVVNSTDAEKAYTAAINDNIDIIDLYLEGEKETETQRERAIRAYKEAQAALKAQEIAYLNTSHAAAESDIRTEKLSVTLDKTTGDISKATATLRDFDDAFRRQTAMEQFRETLPDLKKGLQGLSHELGTVEKQIRKIAASSDNLETFTNNLQLSSPRGRARLFWARLGYNRARCGLRGCRRLGNRTHRRTPFGSYHPHCRPPKR